MITDSVLVHLSDSVLDWFLIRFRFSSNLVFGFRFGWSSFPILIHSMSFDSFGLVFDSDSEHSARSAAQTWPEMVRSLHRSMTDIWLLTLLKPSCVFTVCLWVQSWCFFLVWVWMSEEALIGVRNPIALHERRLGSGTKENQHRVCMYLICFKAQIRTICFP